MSRRRRVTVHTLKRRLMRKLAAASAFECELVLLQLREYVITRTPRTCGNCKHLDPENRDTEWGFCGAENEDYGAYPFQGRSMPLDERCKGWQAREGEGGTR